MADELTISASVKGWKSVGLAYETDLAAEQAKVATLEAELVTLRKDLERERRMTTDAILDYNDMKDKYEVLREAAGKEG